jgi:hypothetical protein
MKTKVMICTMVLLLSAFTGSVFGGTEGITNTFYGTGAGPSTTGDNLGDTFIGAGAGHSNTTGDLNTFVGRDAGYSNTTSGTNTFVGVVAGYSNIGGHHNAFLGNHAGYSNTGGFGNTFLGYDAGWQNTTGSYNTFLGYDAGYENTTGNSNTFVGDWAGRNNTTGNYNTFVGIDAGNNNTTGNYNIFLGPGAGYGNNGSNNIFLGNQAGANETGSDRLYIDNTQTSTPLIYGEFDNRNLTINGNLEVIGPYNGLVYLSDNTNDSTTKVSRMVLNHYSNAEEPVYLFGAASTSTSNFVAFGGGSPLGNAATQLDLFTAESTTTPVGSPRITIKGNGYVGIGTQTPSYPLQMAGGAYTNGSSWVDASSREFKENIEVLSTEEALEAIKELNPVKYAYKTDQTEKRVGFIAEEVPELISMKDRKGLSPMDIVAVLTKVVQEQQKTISTMREELDELKGKVR